MSRKIIGLLLGAWGFAACAEVNVWQLQEAREHDRDPPGMECEALNTRRHDESPLGDIEDLPTDGLIYDLLCPKCLMDARYAVNIPLRRIERYLIPPPSEVWGAFDCAQGCPRWLLRKGDDALLIVHVGAQILCGVTGNCPGLVYERSKGRWTLIAEFNSNESIELCAARRAGGILEFWLTTFDEHPNTWAIKWKPRDDKIRQRLKD